MIDSSGRLPSGALSGTLTDLGEYDQCLQINSRWRDNEVGIRGMYCSIFLRPTLPKKPVLHTIANPLNSLLEASKPGTVTRHVASNAHFLYYISVRIGVCLPAKCDSNDVHTMANKMAKLLSLETKVGSCEVETKSHLNYIQLLISSVKSVFI